MFDTPTPALSSMQSPWMTEDWKPSPLPESNWTKPTAEIAVNTVLALINGTTDLHERPYHPSHWLSRAKSLQTLGYPELAAGDAYKALLLCDAVLTEDDKDLANKVKSSRGMRAKRFQKKRDACKRSSGSQAAGSVDTTNGPTSACVQAIKYEVCFTLVQALETLMSYDEAIDLCRDAAASYHLDDRFFKTTQKVAEKCTEKDAHRGAFIAEQYPWMSFEHKKRQPAIIASCIAHIEGLSNGILTLGESTAIVRHPDKEKRRRKTVRWLDHDQSKPLNLTGKAMTKPTIFSKDFNKKAKLPTKLMVPESDVLGVFATCNIPAGTHLLTDVTLTGAASNISKNMCSNCFTTIDGTPVRHPGSKSRWCSILCRDLALASYHDPINDATPDGVLDWVQQAASNMPSDHPRNLLLLRFIATALHENIHPLNHETAAALTGNYNGQHVSTFTLQESVVVPFRILRDLGVDIFSDTRFETWVLYTLQHRISVSKRAEPLRQGGFMIAINPCFSLFNHSCDANARWNDMGSSTAQIVADRDVGKGEEVTLNYGGSKEWLAYWFGGNGCMCVKCKAS